MTVFVLEQDERVGSLNRRTAVLGFAALGEAVVEFAEADFDALPLEERDIVVGGIGYVRRAFERLQLSVPDLEPIPTALRSFAGRQIWQATMADVRKQVNSGQAVFVKPAPEHPKLFDGRVLSEFRDLIATAHLDDTLVVDCAEPVDFVSEYRVFVVQGEVMGVRPYKGDPLVFPDPEMIRGAIAAFGAAPAAYTLDVGVTAEGKTRLVEINDAYACGAYGLFPIRYARFIAARWDEIWGG